jgi:ATP-dependent Lhr-like helicase
LTLSELHPRLQDFVKDAKWNDLTPIQKKAFEPIYNGANCLIEAPTAGGKTEAVLFPLLTRLAMSRSTGFKVLYVAPLKALLNDLALRVVPYAERCYLEAFKWHGDVGQTEKIQQMSFPSDILLTTPESIEAILLRRSNWIELFANLETVVIDEAHYFALTERGSHLVSLLRRIDHAVNKRPQRIAISATVGNPEEVLSWLIGKERSGQIIRVDGNMAKERDFSILYFRDENPSLQNSLYHLLTLKNKSIVFERSRSATEETATRINERNLALNTRVPVKVRTHHSSVSKRLREDAEGSIRQQVESSLNAIISTSTLELGIDIGHLEQVIQVGGLNSPSSFLQRVGRTGRKPGNPQFFRGLCNDPEELILLAGCVSLGWERISESILFPRKAFHILAHQVICLCLQERGITTSKAWDLLSGVTCFGGISRDEFRELVGFMLERDFLRRLDGEVLLPGDETERSFLKGNWRRLFAIFDTGPSYTVVDGKKIIGTLDSGFARSQELPFVFVLGGQEWNTISLDHDKQQVSVKKNETGVAPKWNVIGSFDVPFELAQEVGRILMNNITLSFLDLEASLEFTAIRNTYRQLGWQKDRWILESSMPDAGVYIWTFAGDKINRCVATLLAGRMSVQPVFDYKKIIIESKKGRSTSLGELQFVIAAFASCTEKALENEIEDRIRNRWFSKFSCCLPDRLSRKAICEKDYDIPGLIRELRTVSIAILGD